MSPDPKAPFDPSRAATDAARHVATTARHAARHARFRAHCDRTPWFFGSLMIGMGLLFLLDNLNIIEARFVFRNLWPLVIVFFGLSRLLFGRGGERVFGAIATTFGSLWLADRLFDWDVNIIGVFWPLILIGLGISMMFRPRRVGRLPSPPPIPPEPSLPGAPPLYSGVAEGAAAAADSDTGSRERYVDEAATLREVAIMAGVERQNVSQAFRGGTITSVMGSVELDLRACRMADVAANIAVQVIMGQVVLRLPVEWTVESRLATVLGNLEDRSERPVQSGLKRLILEGSVFMGQVEIRN